MTEVEPDDELPPPSVELVLLGAMTMAFLRSQETREAREDFIRDVSDVLAAQQRFGNVVRLRPAAHDAELARARTEAAEWWAAIAPVLVARL